MSRPNTINTAQPNQRGKTLDVVIGLLHRPEGATVADIQAVTGWLPHTTRGYLSKGGPAGKAATITNTRNGKATVYSIR
jgi:hypothetical protein